MIKVLVQSLILASGGLFSVGSITLVILLLISKKGWRNGLGYMLGYTITYTLIGVSVILIGFNTENPDGGDPGMFMPILFIVLGAVLLWIALQNTQKPEIKSPNKPPPRLFAFVDKTTPPKAFAFGAMVSVINFKNLAIYLSALSVVYQSKLELSSKIVTVLSVTLVFCLSIITPVIIYLLFPKNSKELLKKIKQKLEANSRSIGIGLPFIFGLVFLFKGVIELL